jgi:hypothetical protein
MRLITFICVIALSAFSCLAQTGKADFSFHKTVNKFGKVKEGEIITFTYTFTNSGTEPLIISDIKVSCGCTVPKYPKQPIAPGAEETITVTFDTKGKIGYQDRTLEIISNAKKSPAIIRFKGMVDNK